MDCIDGREAPLARPLSGERGAFEGALVPAEVCRAGVDGWELERDRATGLLTWTSSIHPMPIKSTS